MRSPSPPARWRTFLRVVAAVAFVLAGSNHFRNPSFYKSIIPPGLPAPGALVAISGICEIAGGLGLLIRPLRRAAGWGLIALLIAVFPANVYMLQHPDSVPNLRISTGLLWARLPLQAVFILWIWYASLARETNAPESQVSFQ